MTINSNKKTMERLVTEVVSGVLTEAKAKTHKGKSTKLGGEDRFQQFVDKLVRDGHTREAAKKIAAKKGIKKHDKKKMTAMAVAGKKKKTTKKKTSLKESLFGPGYGNKDENIVGGLPGGELGEVAPPGWEKTVKKMKKSKKVKNPWQLAWWMHNKGYKPHEADQALDEMMPLGEEGLEDEGLDADMVYSRGNLINQPMREIGESDVDETAMFFDEDNEKWGEHESESDFEPDLDSLSAVGRADAEAAREEDAENELIDDMYEHGVHLLKQDIDPHNSLNLLASYLEEQGQDIEDLDTQEVDELMHLAEKAMHLLARRME